MIDAAGAIYVIGGASGSTSFHDVWASTDGGARPDSVQAVVLGYRVGIQGGTNGVIPGYYRGTTEVLEGCLGVLGGYSRGC